MIVFQRLVDGMWLIFNLSVLSSTVCTGRSWWLLEVAVIVVGGLAAAGCRMRFPRWLVESVVVVVGWRRHRHRYHGHWRTCLCTRISVSMHHETTRSRLNSSACFFALFVHKLVLCTEVHRLEYRKLAWKVMSMRRKNKAKLWVNITKMHFLIVGNRGHWF